MPKRTVLLLLVVAAVAVGLGASVRYLSPTSGKTGGKSPDFVFATLDGKVASLGDWRGKVVVLNFWATWCPPCREEMPAFSAINSQLAGKPVQFVGIGIDTPDNIANFQKATPVSYPLFIAGYETLKQTAELGNKSLSLPFTIIVDQSGNIALAHQGKLDEHQLLQHLKPLLAAKESVRLDK